MIQKREQVFRKKSPPLVTLGLTKVELWRLETRKTSPLQSKEFQMLRRLHEPRGSRYVQKFEIRLKSILGPLHNCNCRGISRPPKVGCFDPLKFPHSQIRFWAPGIVKNKFPTIERASNYEPITVDETRGRDTYKNSRYGQIMRFEFLHNCNWMGISRPPRVGCFGQFRFSILLFFILFGDIG